MIPKRRPDLGLGEIFSAVGSGTTRAQFEKAVAEKTGAKFGLAFAYAHAGFYTLIKALGLEQAEIIIPAYQCDIMAKVVVATGNIPVFAEVDMTDYNMNLQAMRRAITKNTRMIIATYMFGYPTSLQAIRDTAGSQNITILEDATLTFPGALTGDKGLESDVAIYSFGPGKPLFTVRGGMVLTNNADLYEKMLAYRESQMNSLPREEWAKRWALLGIHYLLSKGPIYQLANSLHLPKDFFRKSIGQARTWEVEKELVDNYELQYDYATRYTDFQAHIGLAQLRKMDTVIAKRRAHAKFYDEALSELKNKNIVRAPVVEGATYSPYAVLVPGRDARKIEERMFARGIELGHTFNYSMPTMKEYRAFARGNYPNAERLGLEVINLPAHANLTTRQTQMVVDRLHQVLSE